MGLKFERPFVVKFSHCDSTELVFHPNFFAWAVDTEELFFREVLGEELFGPGVTRGLFVPMAGARAEFVLPLRAGDAVLFRLWIERLGRSSVRWAFEIVKAGKPAVWIAETLVFTRLQSDGTFKAVEIPADFREKMLPYLKEPGEPGLAFRS